MTLNASEGSIPPYLGSPFEYQEEVNDIRSIMSDACELLHESDAVQFIVRGFSEVPWAVDVETDLPVVLEQLPEAVRALRGREKFSIAFYEQGVERSLNFNCVASQVEIECTSWKSTWKPIPTTLTVEHKDLEELFRGLGEDFYRLVKVACGDLAAHPWLREWKRSVTP